MAETNTFSDLMNGFGVVTVMNARIYELDEASYVGNDKGLKPGDFKDSTLYLDTLKIANLTQEGPTKTITGGQYSNPLIKYGKTMKMEMQDALGRGAVLEKFFGCEWDQTTNVISIGDNFPGAFAIEGDTFFINQKTGEQETVHILIPQFLPDAILSLTQDAEGDATVFDLTGTVSMTKILKDDLDTTEPKAVFYQIRKDSWFDKSTN